MGSRSIERGKSAGPTPSSGQLHPVMTRTPAPKHLLLPNKWKPDFSMLLPCRKVFVSDDCPRWHIQVCHVLPTYAVPA